MMTWREERQEGGGVSVSRTRGPRLGASPLAVLLEELEGLLHSLAEIEERRQD